MNDPALAEAATQTVFAHLAGAPPVVITESELLGWFHQPALVVTLTLRPSDSCPKKQEPIQSTLSTDTAEGDPPWNEIALALDEAIENLSPTEKQAVLVKFFKDKSHHDGGSKLGFGIGNDISQIHLGRALKRLRLSFFSKEIICTLGALATLLDHHAIDTAPASLVVRLSLLPQLSGGTPASTSETTPKGWLSKIAAVFHWKRGRSIVTYFLFKILYYY
ncbi:MAG: hypothetical protein EXS36_15995 [Pedosphaera sp.]|nr:hypothetical protein [Pedosphaera sp.]